MSPHATILGRVSELHRYPVKSLTGEQVPRLRVEERGVVGDRLWSVRDPDGKLGSGKSSRRFRRMPGLLELRARYDEPYDGVPVLTFPDGRTVDGDDPGPLLSGWKDTVFVDRGSTVRLLVRFTDYADPDTPYMFHCHVLRHEDQGMMGQLVVVDPETG